MKSKYTLDVFKDKKGEWRWHLKRRGRIVATSGEGYKRKATMLKSYNNMVRSGLPLVSEKQP